MKYNELKKILAKHNCTKSDKTNHEWWFSPITNKSFPVPRHGTQEVPKGTLKSIEKLSGIKF